MKSIWTFLLTSTSCCHPSGFKNRDRLVRKCPECCFKMFQGDSRFVNRKHSEALGKVSADSAWDACIPGGCDLPREPWMSIGAVLVVNLLEVFSVDTHDVLLHVVTPPILVLWFMNIYDGLFHVCVSKLGCFPVFNLTFSSDACPTCPLSKYAHLLRRHLHLRAAGWALQGASVVG